MLKVIATKKGFYKGLRDVGEEFHMPKDMLPKKPTWFKEVKEEKIAPVFATSTDDGCTIPKAQNAIKLLETEDEVLAFCLGDDRQKVLEAAEKRIALLNEETEK